MSNGYKFNNEYYKDIVDNMKLTIFDIIANEEVRLSKVADILNSQPEGTDISVGVDLYNNQKNCITTLTLIANDLSSNLSQFDKNSSLIDDAFDFGENTNVNEQHVENNNSNEVNEVSSENVPDSVEKTPDVVPEETLVQDMAAEETSVAAEESVTDEIVSAPVEEAPVELENTADEIVPAPVEEAPAESENTADEIVPAPVDEAPIESESTADEIVPAPVEGAPIESESAADEIVPAPVEGAPTESESAADEIVPAPVEEAPAESESVADEIVPAPAEETPAESESTADEIISAPAEETHAESESTADEIVPAPVEEAPVVLEEGIVNETDSEDKMTISSNVISADSLDDDDVVEDNKPIASLTEEKVDDTTTDEKIDFVVIDPTFSRAIITTKKQTKNLRDSLISKTQEFNTFVLKNKDVSDKDLIDNGLLEPVDDIESKIEKMMEDANNLYKEGKTDEAQALYEKISELNNQLKETSVSK